MAAAFADDEGGGTGDGHHHGRDEEARLDSGSFRGLRGFEARLDAALQATHIVGLATNVAFLRRVAASTAFSTAVDSATVNVVYTN